jgi:glycosyltransferase involved in cell wall biosynthesis
MTIKILNIVPSYFPATVYGGVIFSAHFTNALLTKNYKNFIVTVSTSTANGEKRLYTKNRIILKKKNYIIKYYYDEIINRISISFIKNIFNDIKNNSIIHFQDIFSTFAIVGIIFACILNKKIIISPRGVLSYWSLKSKYTFMKKIIFYIFFKKKNYYWHVTSEIERKDLTELGIKKRVFIIPNIIDDKILKTSGKLIKKNSSYVVGCLSRYDKKKGIDSLVESFNFLNKKFILIIAGPDFGYKNHIENLIQYKRLEKRVFLYNNLNSRNKEKFFNTIDLLALPSHNENFGNVFLESLKRGKPILTSNFTPFYNISKFKCGINCDINSKKISEAIIKIHKKNKNTLKRNAIEYSKNFDSNKIIKKYYLMYETIYKKN